LVATFRSLRFECLTSFNPTVTKKVVSGLCAFSCAASTKPFVLGMLRIVPAVANKGSSALPHLGLCELFSTLPDHRNRYIVPLDEILTIPMLQRVWQSGAIRRLHCRHLFAESSLLLVAQTTKDRRRAAQPRKYVRAVVCLHASTGQRRRSLPVCWDPR
jgi:hypothetical protein